MGPYANASKCRPWQIFDVWFKKQIAGLFAEEGSNASSAVEPLMDLQSSSKQKRQCVHVRACEKLACSVQATGEPSCPILI